MQKQIDFPLFLAPEQANELNLYNVVSPIESARICADIYLSTVGTGVTSQYETIHTIMHAVQQRR